MGKSRFLGASVRSCLVLATLYSAAPAMAQLAPSPSRVTPETVRPETLEPDGRIMLPETRTTAAPPGAENLSVRISSFEVSGSDARHASDISAITSPLAGHTVRIADLYRAAAQIEALYAREGQILTRATIPPQELTDGAIVQIRIIEGFIEAVDASAVPKHVRKPVEERAARLVGKSGLTMEQIERSVILAGRVPGVSLQSTLVPGQKTGGAVLVLKADWKPVNVLIGADNRLSDDYGNWAFDDQIVLNSVLGGGEQLYWFASTATDFELFGESPERRIQGLGAIVPVNNDGLALNPEYIRADTNPKAASGTIPIRGKLDHAALRLSYPLVLSRRESLKLGLSFDLLNEKQSIPDFGLSLSEDRLRYASLGLEWAKSYSKGIFVSLDGAVTQGIDGLGARNQADAEQSGILLSRIGSSPDFTYVNLSASLRAPIGDVVRLSVMLRGQGSLSGALPASQQFSLDHFEGLSGFSLGSINTDSGLTGRSELSLLTSTTALRAEPYLFGAAGVGKLSNPTALERADIDGWSAGGGLRTQLAGHVRAEAELARADTNILSNADTRLTVRVSVQF